MMKWLYKHSLSLVLLVLFLAFLAGQNATGFLHYNEEQETHGQPTVTYMDYLKAGAFAESVFENRQSEFLAVYAIVVLSVYLRQHGSPESKPVSAPRAKTGSE